MTIQEIKQQFFSFRNGIVAKAFLDAGAPYKTMFGLQLPQLSEIARGAGTDHQLALTLWADSGCRESRLLACWLFDKDKITKEDALRLAQEAATREETDILVFRLLRHLPFAEELKESLSGYTKEALIRNLES